MLRLFELFLRGRVTRIVHNRGSLGWFQALPSLPKNTGELCGSLRSALLAIAAACSSRRRVHVRGSCPQLPTPTLVICSRPARSTTRHPLGAGNSHRGAPGTASTAPPQALIYTGWSTVSGRNSSSSLWTMDSSTSTLCFKSSRKSRCFVRAISRSNSRWCSSSISSRNSDSLELSVSSMASPNPARRSEPRKAPANVRMAPRPLRPHALRPRPATVWVAPVSQSPPMPGAPVRGENLR